MIKLDENSVAKIIKIAMTNNEKCNSYEYYLKEDTRND